MTDRPQPRFGDSAKWRPAPSGRDPSDADRAQSEPALTLPVGSVLSLIGGLGLLAAFYMPWFAIQGLLLSGDFLARFLGNPAQLRQFAPALAGSPGDVQLLRTVVYLFPLFGGLGTILALGYGFWRRRPGWLCVVLSLTGLIPLVALAGGVTRLPPGSAPETGLWVIGVASVALLAGPWVDHLLARPRQRA